MFWFLFKLINILDQYLLGLLILIGFRRILALTTQISNILILRRIITWSY